MYYNLQSSIPVKQVMQITASPPENQLAEVSPQPSIPPVLQK